MQIDKDLQEEHFFEVQLHTYQQYRYIIHCSIVVAVVIVVVQKVKISYKSEKGGTEGPLSKVWFFNKDKKVEKLEKVSKQP